MADKARWFGSMRIRRDGRMSFSPWSYPDLPHVSLMVRTDEQIYVVSAGVVVMVLHPERNRIRTASFVPDLEPDHFREVVAELREHVRDGLESWIVPALEWNLFHSYVKDGFPKTHKLLPELLASCRALPVAARWKQIRENVRASADWTRSNAGKTAKANTASRKQRGKAIRTRKPKPRK